MTAALQKAIGGLYDAFACEPRPSRIEGCPCCLDEKGTSVLLSKPLHSLTPDDLSKYAQSIFLTVGSESDFKYFLPRILEILATEDGWWPGPEVVGRAIADSKWNHFSPAQQNAISVFFNEVLIDLIEAKDGWAIDQWICGIARGLPDVHPYLNLVEKNPPALIAYYEANSESLTKGKLRNSFWSDESLKEKLLLDWFQSDEVRNLINATYELQ
jgi:hypothetical protein